MKTLRVLRVIIFLCLSWSMNTYSIEYPYMASPDRAYKIRTQFINIREGMNSSDVKEVMGYPDEIRDLYEAKIKDAKKKGYTYWYIIQRKVEHGSVLEKDEKLVRITFDLRDQVIKVDHWGFSLEH